MRKVKAVILCLSMLFVNDSIGMFSKGGKFGNTAKNTGIVFNIFSKKIIPSIPVRNNWIKTSSPIRVTGGFENGINKMMPFARNFSTMLSVSDVTPITIDAIAGNLRLKPNTPIPEEIQSILNVSSNHLLSMKGKFYYYSYIKFPNNFTFRNLIDILKENKVLFAYHVISHCSPMSMYARVKQNEGYRQGYIFPLTNENLKYLIEGTQKPQYGYAFQESLVDITYKTKEEDSLLKKRITSAFLMPERIKDRFILVVNFEEFFDVERLYKGKNKEILSETVKNINTAVCILEKSVKDITMITMFPGAEPEYDDPTDEKRKKN